MYDDPNTTEETPEDTFWAVLSNYIKGGGGGGGGGGGVGVGVGVGVGAKSSKEQDDCLIDDCD